MSIAHRIAGIALIAALGCESQAKRVAMSATSGVKEKVAQIDPAIASTIAEEAARGAKAGVLAEVNSEEFSEAIDAVFARASKAATRGVLTALQEGELQQLADRTVASAVSTVGRQLSEDTTVRDQLGAISHQVSASAVYGARDALADSFPECTGSSNWRRCVEGEMHAMARSASRGLIVGIVDAIKWPILALVFLAGALFTLLLVRGRSAVTRGRHGHPGDIAAPKPAA
jgi:hypothetical protein